MKQPEASDDKALRAAAPAEVKHELFAVDVQLTRQVCVFVLRCGSCGVHGVSRV